MENSNKNNEENIYQIEEDNAKNQLNQCQIMDLQQKLALQQQLITHQQNQFVENRNLEIRSIYSMTELLMLYRKITLNTKIKANLTNTKYNVIKHLVKEYFQWQIILNAKNSKNCNITWTDQYVTEDIIRELRPYQKINHFPGSQNLGRKNLLGKNLANLNKKFPKEYNFYPRTWRFPYQLEDLRQFSSLPENKNQWYILKPEASCQGKGIQILKKFDQIDISQNYVVQQYIAKPYLIDGLKFDFRIYVLVKSIDPLKIFIYQEGLARFATEPYEEPNKKNINQVCMHLTNYAINKKNKNFSPNQNPFEDNQGHKRSFSAVLAFLFSQGHNVDTLFMKIRQMIIKTICSVQPYLSHFYKTCRPANENLELAFEIFGQIQYCQKQQQQRFDILLDENLNPILLEVNHTPSFSTDSPLDWNIKKNLILDTLNLMHIRQKDKKIYNENKNNPLKASKLIFKQPQKRKQKILDYEKNHCGGYLKIYPSNFDELNSLYDLFMATSKEIWDEFAGPKRLKIICPPHQEENITKDQQSKNNKILTRIKSYSKKASSSRNENEQSFAKFQKFSTQTPNQVEINNDIYNFYGYQSQNICNLNNKKIEKPQNHNNENLKPTENGLMKNETEQSSDVQDVSTTLLGNDYNLEQNQLKSIYNNQAQSNFDKISNTQISSQKLFFQENKSNDMNQMSCYQKIENTSTNSMINYNPGQQLISEQSIQNTNSSSNYATLPYVSALPHRSDFKNIVRQYKQNQNTLTTVKKLSQFLQKNYQFKIYQQVQNQQQLQQGKLRGKTAQEARQYISKQLNNNENMKQQLNNKRQPYTNLQNNIQNLIKNQLQYQNRGGIIIKTLRPNTSYQNKNSKMSLHQRFQNIPIKHTNLYLIGNKALNSKNNQSFIELKFQEPHKTQLQGRQHIIEALNLNQTKAFSDHNQHNNFINFQKVQLKLKGN